MSVTVSVAHVASSPVATQLVAAVESARAAIAAGPDAVGSGREAGQLIQVAEQLRRLAAVCATQALAEVDRSGAYRDHGHPSARVMVKHHSRASGADAHRLDQVNRMCQQADRIRVAWWAGELSLDRAAILARAFSNPRVREQFCAEQDWFLARAGRGTTAQFERRVARWVRLADFDGAAPGADPGHQNRSVALVQDFFSRQWTWRGTHGSLQGSKLRRILDAYVHAEFAADWAAAEVDHGDQVHRGLLARTDAQRRADAVEQIFADAINNPQACVRIDTVHNIVWSADSFEELLARFAGAEPTPLDPDTHRCAALDGSDLDESAAFADALVSEFRAVVQDAAGVTVEMTSRHRFFVGNARLGTMLSADECYWPGCDVPVTACQIDHLRPAARGGLTEQRNGRPACSHHNRTKERGFTVTLGDGGSIEILTPNGQVVPE